MIISTIFLKCRTQKLMNMISSGKKLLFYFCPFCPCFQRANFRQFLNINCFYLKEYLPVFLSVSGRIQDKAKLFASVNKQNKHGAKITVNTVHAYRDVSFILFLILKCIIKLNLFFFFTNSFKMNQNQSSLALHYKSVFLCYFILATF